MSASLRPHEFMHARTYRGGTASAETFRGHVGASAGQASAGAVPSSTMRNTAFGTIPSRRAVPAGSSIAALAPRTSELARHGRMEWRIRTTRPSPSTKTTSSGKRMKNMWTELHGRSANPCPAGSSARNMSPRNRERIPSATTTWSATTAPVTVSSLYTDFIARMVGKKRGCAVDDKDGGGIVGP